MKPLSKIIFLIISCLLISFEAHSQRELKIITDLDHSFERYTVTIYDSNNVVLTKQMFYTPDTTIIYTFSDSNHTKSVDVMLSGAIGIRGYFNVAKKVPLRSDTLCTTYHLNQISKKEIRDYKNHMDHPIHPYSKKEYGIFNKQSPWMYCIGYSYQKSHLINLEVRKTGVDISGSHNDGLYGLTLLDAPYFIFGADATISPNFQLAPKLGLGYYYVFVNANISVVGYNTHFSRFDPAILPEVGLSFPFGFLHIDYGYNLFLNKLDTFDKNNQRISLRLSWYFNPKKVMH